MLEIVLSIIASVVSGATLFLVERGIAKHDREEKASNKTKQKENILILKSINAIGKLSNASAIALHEGRTNGEMKNAMETYEDVEGELYDYFLEQNSKKK